MQIVYLYALSHSDPDAFNLRYRNKPFHLKFHRSTGATRYKYFFRCCSCGARWHAWHNMRWNRLGSHWTDDKVLRTAWPGSRVMWSNETIGKKDPRVSSRPWRNENTIKVGPNRYRAYPFSQIIMGIDDLSGMQISRLLAAWDESGSERRAIARSADDASDSVKSFAQDHIYLKEVTLLRQSP